MFAKVQRTVFPPQDKPILIYDGNCGFCKYWIIKWRRMTRESIQYFPYQKVASQFSDIPEDYFRQAVRYIDTDGTVGNGPEAAFQTLYIKKKYRFLLRWYRGKTWFRMLSDRVYQWIADHRTFLFKLSRLFFGKKP